MLWILATLATVYDYCTITHLFGVLVIHEAC